MATPTGSAGARTGWTQNKQVRLIGERTRYGEGGIRTLDRAFQPYNGLANRRLQPLGHLSLDVPHDGPRHEDLEQRMAAGERTRPDKFPSRSAVCTAFDTCLPDPKSPALDARPAQCILAVRNGRVNGLLAARAAGRVRVLSRGMIVVRPRHFMVEASRDSDPRGLGKIIPGSGSRFP
jgi:hypothetical protein